MRLSLLALSLALATPALAADDLREAEPVRAVRKQVGVQLEGGWNGLAGAGLLVNVHLHPMFTLDLGAGLGGVGPKLGLRGRWNIGQGNFVQYLGLGYMHGFGTLGESATIETQGNPFGVEVLPSNFVQGVYGIEWIADGGFTVGANAGYAYQLGEAGSNIRYTSGSPTDAAAGRERDRLRRRPRDRALARLHLLEGLT